MNTLEIRCLGGLDLRRDGQPVEGLITTKVQALFCYLAITRRSHARLNLADLLWGNMPEPEARNNLRQALHHLRQHLSDHLQITRQTVSFNEETPYRLDVDAFMRLAATKPSEHPNPKDLEQAVALYRGDFLDGVHIEDAIAFEEWMLRQRERLRTQMVQTLDRLGLHHARRGQYTIAIQHTARQLELEPWHEETHRQLMLSLARNGQRSAALKQFQICKETLKTELNVAPSTETQELHDRIRNAPASPPNNLPNPPTPFVGREADVADLCERFEHPDCRLLTLVGPGGIGKTRLAMEVAARKLTRFWEGVYVVSLEGADSAEVVYAALAEAVGLTPSPMQDVRPQLLGFLREKELLLVLDDVDQLQATPLPLEWLLSQARKLKMLATSRRRLNSKREWLFEVSGLTYPSEHAEQPIDTYSGTRLFLERAKQLGVEVGPSESDSLAHVCRLVEGMPLALELAATWKRVLSIAEIASEIERGIEILASNADELSERHRSLSAVFEQSWDMLTPHEQSTFSRLSVFRGGFDRNAAETITGADLAVLEGLIDKSMLRRKPDGRFGLHELLRQFAAGKLAQSTRAKLRQQHAQYFWALTQDAEANLWTESQPTVIARLEADHDNLRASLAFALESDDPRLNHELGGSLWGFWTLSGNAREALRWFEAMLDQFPAAPDPLRVKAVLGSGFAGWLVDDLGLAHTRLQEALKLSQALDFEVGVLISTWLLGHLCWEAGQSELAKDLLEQSIQRAQDAKFELVIPWGLHTLGLVMRQQGQLEAALDNHRHSMDHCEALGLADGKAYALAYQGLVNRELGHFDEATILCEKALTLFRAQNHEEGMAHALHFLGLIAQDQGDDEDAWSKHLKALGLSGGLDARRIVCQCLDALALLFAQANTHTESATVLGAADAERGRRLAALGATHAGGDRLVDLDDLRQKLHVGETADAYAHGQTMSTKAAIEYVFKHFTQA